MHHSEQEYDNIIKDVSKYLNTPFTQYTATEKIDMIFATSAKPVTRERHAGHSV